MAKTYLEAAPQSERNVIIMDSAKSIGGTWAGEKLYAGLRTNNVVSTFEFSDFPMDLNKYALKPGQHIPGQIVHRYLSDFAAKYDLTSIIRLQTRVNATTLLDDGTWQIRYSINSTISGEQSIVSTGDLVARKLVIATGLTSEPSIPQFPGRDLFKGNLFHSQQLNTWIQDLANSSKVVVIGGNKSAFDACYAAARSGAETHMVVRPSGGGPSWLWRPIGIGPFRISISRISSIRLFTLLDPSPFGSVWANARHFFHRTGLGRFICSLFWAGLDLYGRKVNGYSQSGQMRMLQPWSSTFWMGNSLSIHNYETDWFSLVKNGQITVHHADIASLGEHTINLSNGEKLETNTVICCTGWKAVPAIAFNPDGISSHLGLPEASVSGQSQLEGHPEFQSQRFENKITLKADDDVLIDAIRRQIMKQTPQLDFKYLRRGSKHTIDEIHMSRNGNFEDRRESVAPDRASYSLYRFVVPPNQQFLEMRNVAFIGAHASIHTAIVAQAQALWITAFFQRKLPAFDLGRINYETHFHTEYERIRRPKWAGGFGGRFPDLVFDSIPYIDLLLEDLGMRTKRKRSWWRNICEPHTAGDYEGLVHEWLDNNKKNIME